MVSPVLLRPPGEQLFCGSSRDVLPFECSQAAMREVRALQGLSQLVRSPYRVLDAVEVVLVALGRGQTPPIAPPTPVAVAHGAGRKESRNGRFGQTVDERTNLPGIGHSPGMKIVA